MIHYYKNLGNYIKNALVQFLNNEKIGKTNDDNVRDIITSSFLKAAAAKVKQMRRKLHCDAKKLEEIIVNFLEALIAVNV